MSRIQVALEVGARRSFARAVEWPGWTRAGKTEAEALQALAAYAPRYRKVVRDRSFPAVDDPSAFEVVERVDGDATTDFGAPGVAAPSDDRPLDGDEVARLERLLDAAWSAFDAAVDAAQGVELRKGPRGGGRDVDGIVDHVREAERAYLGQLGARPPGGEDPGPLRAAVVATLRARATGGEIENPRATKRRWAPRYFVHRAAWHVLDHAWEIEDRST